MIWAILGCVAALIGGVGWWWSEAKYGRRTLDDYLMLFPALLFAACIAGLAVTVLNGVTYLVIPDGNTRYVDGGVTRLAQIAPSSATQGSFFLGSGVVDEKPVYRFYAEQAGGLALRSVNADAVVVHQGDGVPRIVRHEAVQAHPWWSLFSEGGDYYDVYVPTGSIAPDYDLNVL